VGGAVLEVVVGGVAEFGEGPGREGVARGVGGGAGKGDEEAGGEELRLEDGAGLLGKGKVDQAAGEVVEVAVDRAERPVGQGGDQGLGGWARQHLAGLATKAGGERLLVVEDGGDELEGVGGVFDAGEIAAGLGEAELVVGEGATVAQGRNDVGGVGRRRGVGAEEGGVVGVEG
jgi:hypothetical protein